MFTIGGLIKNHLVLPTLFFIKKVLKTIICWELLTIILLEFYMISVKMYNFEQSAGNQQIKPFILVGTSETKRSPLNIIKGRSSPWNQKWSFNSLVASNNNPLLNIDLKFNIRTYSTSNLPTLKEKQDNTENLVPLIAYDNFKENRVNIFKEQKDKSGIYCLINKNNGHSYVGSSINLASRMRNYLNTAFLKSKQNINMPIVKALLKYNPSNFKLLILEHVDLKTLTLRETYYITYVLPYYNVLKQGYSSLGYILTKETKALLSQLAKNRVHTDETKALIARALTGENNPFYNKSHSMENKVRIIEAKSTYPVYIYNSFKELLIIFPSVGTLAKLIKSNHPTIVNVIKEGILFRGEWYLEHVPYNISDTPRITSWQSDEGKLLVADMINNCDIVRTIFVYDSNKNFIKKYKGVTQASKDLNINQKFIKQYAKVSGLYKGYLFRFERLHASFYPSGLKPFNNKRSFSTSSERHNSNNNESTVSLNPWFLTGFADAESCFTLSIFKDSSKALGWRVRTLFTIELHEKDIALLELIRDFFGVGKIYSPRSTIKQFKVTTVKDLQVILDHFNKFPLITKKRVDFELFKAAVSLISSKEHLSKEGFEKLLSIRSSLNLGLTSVLAEYFPNVQRYFTLESWDNSIQDPNWLAGFASGEACFFVHIAKSQTTKLGESVQLKFNITQHSRDEFLIKSLADFFNCGKVYSYPDKTSFNITSWLELNNNLIPFFNKYPIKGTKFLDYADFLKVINLMINKAHLTKEGLDLIRDIKSNMNRKRTDV